MVGYEIACMLNTGDIDADVEITLYFSDRPSLGPYHTVVQARRTLHQRFNDLEDPEPVPRGVDYASVIVSDVPIVVQHTRIDTREEANALLWTLAYPVLPGTE